ncbi:MAG TPA: tRNA pseudouridine(13) synthase TruD [Planctomycetaceae bacterium]|nr:tRNA pseudouridine(13) synthase TruD [Planctomycetaceae bacterium]
MFLLDPLDPPRLFDAPIGVARFKSQLEDFQVEEVLGFEPSGEGEHCLAWIEKIDRNSNDVATEIAQKLSIRKRLVNHCGLKDRAAITRQWFSIHLPGIASPSPEQISGNGYRVLAMTRHQRKLRRGGHRANRFVIRLRDCDFDNAAVVDRWQAIESRGVPNYFGPQRFGHNGDNVGLATQMLSGAVDVRDRMLRGILISAARSCIYNACVAQRVADGTWDLPLDGDVFGFADNHSLVLPGKLRGDVAQRVADCALEITAPLWGNGELLSVSVVREMEQRVADHFHEIASGLEKLNLQQERRVIRLRPSESQVQWESNSDLRLRFELPTGTYATTLLREMVRFE